MQAVQRAFGDFVEAHHDSQVVLSTKKGAKQCVAMVPLYDINHSCNVNQANANSVRDIPTNGADRQADLPRMVSRKG